MMWAILALYEDPRNENSAPSRVSASMIRATPTGVDRNIALVLEFPKLGAQVRRQIWAGGLPSELIVAGRRCCLVASTSHHLGMELNEV